jgi:hypothetical protein
MWRISQMGQASDYDKGSVIEHWLFRSSLTHIMLNNRRPKYIEAILFPEAGRISEVYHNPCCIDDSIVTVEVMCSDCMLVAGG